jgi:hypothetical protein
MQEIFYETELKMKLVIQERRYPVDRDEVYLLHMLGKCVFRLVCLFTYTRMDIAMLFRLVI